MQLKSYVYADNGGYAIGEMYGTNYVTGLGYIYWEQSDLYAIGTFNENERNGWVVANGDSGGNKERVYIGNFKGDKMIPGIVFVSYPNMISICETHKGSYNGYNFLIWEDGSWRYQYDDGTGETRAVAYDSESKSLMMTYREDRKDVWVKTINKGDFDTDFSIGFGHFKQKLYSNPGDFIVNSVSINPQYNGPCFDYDSKTGESSIGAVENGKYQGIVVRDNTNYFIAEQYRAGDNHGPYFKIFKDDCQYLYTTYQNTSKDEVEVDGYPKDGSVEIRNYHYSGDEYDAIVIDKNFNVSFYECYDPESEKSENSINYDYEEIYNSKDEETEDPVEVTPEEVEEEERKIRQPKGRKAPAKLEKKVKKGKDDTSSWADEFKSIFDKHLKK